MGRFVRVAAAQMGPTAGTDTREAVITRLLGLLDRAVDAGCELVVFPELALTPYFPKSVRDDYDRFFETSMPNPTVEPLFTRARAAGVSFYLGYAEKTPDGRRFNTAIFVDGQGTVLHRYRKIHLPGLPRGRGPALVYEPHYFEPGEDGFAAFDAGCAHVGMALCQDRRYPETFRVLALQGAEIVLLGYNTPVLPLSWSHNELSMCSGAYANGIFVVGVAKAGTEDGMRLLGGTCVIDPHGQIVARASSEADELVTATLDLAEITRARGHWNFFARRQPQHYGPLTEPVADRTFVTSTVPL